MRRSRKALRMSSNQSPARCLLGQALASAYDSREQVDRDTELVVDRIFETAAISESVVRRRRIFCQGSEIEQEAREPLCANDIAKALTFLQESVRKVTVKASGQSGRG